MISVACKGMPIVRVYTTDKHLKNKTYGNYKILSNR
jgi:hypothetical protein